MKNTTHRTMRELLVSGEWTDEQRRALDAHLEICEECREFSAGLKELEETLGRRRTITISEEELLEMRRDLRAVIRRERTRVSAAERVRGWLFLPPSVPVRHALLAGLPLLAGLAIGYAIFTGTTEFTGLPLHSAAAVSQYEQGGIQVTGVRFLDADPESGIVEFTFQAVRPVRVQGNIHDEEIQRILARALLSEENPGVRIRTVSALAATAASGEKAPDPKIKAALIKTVKEDPNPGVRKEALKALQNVAMDAEIRDALIHVLVADRNEGMRIDAINSLTSLEAQHPVMGNELISVLQRRMESDHNNYIRLRAEAMLKEVQQ